MKKIITLLFICLGMSSQAQSVCFGESYTLTATNPQSLTNVTYSMNPGAVTGTSAVFVVTPTAAAIYTLYTTGTNSASTLVTSTYTSWVFVQAMPVVTPSYTQASCSSTVNGFNFNITFTPQTSPAFNITWSPTPPTGVFSPTQYSAMGGIAGGVYSATITTSSNCSTTVTFTMLPTPVQNTMQVTKSYPLLCPGVASTLTGIPSTYSYTWSTGATTSSISVSPTVTTTYSVISVNAGGCTATMSINQPVSSLPSVSLAATRTLLCIGDSAIMSGSGSVAYLWNTGSTSSSIKVKPVVSTDYTLTGTSLDNCDSKSVVTLSVINCTSIKNNSTLANGIQLYPNPAKEELNIVLQMHSGINVIRILNLLGEEIYNSKLSGSVSKINVSQWPKGLYYYQVLSGNEILQVGSVIKD